MGDFRKAGEANPYVEPSLTHTLRLTLVAALASSLAIAAFTLILKWPLVPRLSILAAALILMALLLSHSGRVRPTVLFALAGIAYAVLYAAAKTDGIQSIGLATVPVLVVVSSLLLDRRK